MSAKLIRTLSFLLLFISSCVVADKNPILPIQTWTTSTGTPVFYVYEKELPMIDIQVVFDAGSSRDLSQPGIAKITSDALSSGTTTKTANQIAAAFDDVGALYSSAANRDMAIVAMRSLSDPKFLQPAFAAFSDILSHASFPENEFLRIKKQTLNNLEEQDELPASIAAKAFYNAIFANSPYGHPVSGTKQSVSRFTADNLRTFYKTTYTANNALIAIVGDVNQAKAKELAEYISSNLSKGPVLTSTEFSDLSDKAIIKHINFPSSQTHVLIGQVGINRNNPNYFPIIVGNYVLGGGMLTSRLFDEVREKRGLAYTVHSQFSAMKNKGPFIIELQTRNSEAKNAIKVVTDTVTNFISTGPTDRELESAKKNLTQGFILKLASNSAIMAQLINIGYYKLPLNYLDTYQDNVLSVSNQQVKAVFQKIVHPENLVTITVGNNTLANNAATPH